MHKAALIEQIRAALEAEMAAVAASAADAHSAATHEDAKPENQYDTRGLEASYLAGAQAGRVQDLAHRINSLEFVPVKVFGPQDPIALTAVVTLDDGERTRRYFLAPDGGGLKVNDEQGQLFVITPKSPIGRALIDKVLGDIVQVPLKRKLIEMELVEVA